MAKQSIIDLMREHGVLDGKLEQRIEEIRKTRPAPAPLILEAKEEQLSALESRLTYLDGERDACRREIETLRAEIDDDRKNFKAAGVDFEIKKKTSKKLAKKVTAKTGKKTGKKPG